VIPAGAVWIQGSAATFEPEAHRVITAAGDSLSYDVQPVSSFLVDPTKERWSMFLVETRVFPWVYWHRVLKGRLHESRFLKPFAPLVRVLGLTRKES
jgi:sulfide:quinone oxidoreductase